MVNTALIPPNLGRLEKRLLQHLQGDQIALTPQSVHCRLEGETLFIALYFETRPFLETTAIFAAVRDCLSQAGLTTLYRPQIFLVLDEEVALRDGDASAIQPQISPAPDFSAPSLGVFPAVGESESRQRSPLSRPWRESLLARLRRHRRLLLWGLGAGAVLSLGYGLSRPCVLGPCPPLTRAESQLRTAGALNPWETTLETLQAIPPWSPYFRRSQALLDADQKGRQDLALLEQAARLAQRAERQSDSRQSRDLWRSSLRLLGQISPPSPFHGLALARTQNYRRQLRRLDQQVSAQQQANLERRRGNQLLTEAKLKAKGAKTLADLEAALQLWRQGRQHLERIPPESDLRALAQQQLILEQSEFKQLEAKQALEARAQKTLQGAQGLAQKAESAANRRQFSEALGHWQGALASLKKIPAQSWLGPQAQTLLARYQFAEQQSRQTLQQALRSQFLQKNLQTLCAGPTRFCDYQIESKRIKIALKSNYLQTLQQGAQEGGQAEQAQILRHVQALEGSLQEISRQASLPVDLYRSSGEKIARFQPGGAGH